MDSPIIDLDALMGRKPTEESQGSTGASAESTESESSAGESPESEQGESETTEDGDKDSDSPQGDAERVEESNEESTEEVEQEGGETEGQESQTQEEASANDDVIDLEDLFLEGEDKPVSELLVERDQLKAERDNLQAAVEFIEKDEFLRGLLEHYQEHGNVEAYLDAKAKNWDNVDTLELLRMRHERENADVDPKIREKLFKRELAAKYMVKDDLSEYDKESEDYEIAQELLKRDANKFRQQLKDEQKKFQLPTKKVDEPAKEQEKYNPEAYKQELLKVKEVDAFIKSKLLPLGVKGENGDVYGFEAENTDQIIEMMSNDVKFFQTFMKEGKPDLVKQAKVYAFAINPDKYEQELVNLGKTLGQEERLKDQKNTDGRLSKKSVQQQGTPERGTPQWKAAFLEAAQRQTRK
jgi:hypothetical protein